jgi:ribosomal protein S18 acetylase RimI-like enzyme
MASPVAGGSAKPMVTIRRATTNDAARITETHVRSWQSAYRGIIPQDYLDSLDPAERLIARQQMLALVNWGVGGVLVAEDESGLTGFADFGPTRDADKDPGLVGEIRAIYLAPAAWGRGHGRELMTASLSGLTAVGYVEATLWVLDRNERARGFYEAAGFRADGCVKEYDGPGFTLPEVRYRRLLT